MKNILSLIILIFFLSSIQCKQEPPANKITFEKKESKSETQEKKIPNPIITYHLVPVKSKSVSWLRSDISDDSLNVLLAVNRVDKEHLLKQDTIVVPDTFMNDLKAYSPFPDSIQELKTIHKIIFFSYSIEAFAAYESGVLIRWGPVSMGKRITPTPTRLFHTNWKSEQAISTVDAEWIMNWYFNLDNFRGVSMHEYDLPGYPASHACVRLLTDDAYWLYNWADQWILKDASTISAYGTPVIIYGAYPFGKRKPWRALAENNKALLITEASLTTEVHDFLPLLLEQQAQRDSVLKTKGN